MNTLTCRLVCTGRGRQSPPGEGQFPFGVPSQDLSLFPHPPRGARRFGSTLRVPLARYTGPSDRCVSVVRQDTPQPLPTSEEEKRRTSVWDRPVVYHPEKGGFGGEFGSPILTEVSVP